MTINISAADLKTIQSSGQKITICKQLNKPYVAVDMAFDVAVKSMGSSTSNAFPIAWLVFSPFQTNLIQWNNEYSFFASSTSIVAGNVIFMNASSSVQSSLLYSFSSDGFSVLSTNALQGYFNLKNLQSDLSSFGLAQEVEINGAQVGLQAVNMVTILNNQEANFQSSETVCVFLSNTEQSSTILPRVASSALTVELTPSTPTVTLGFNGANNSFYLA